MLVVVAFLEDVVVDPQSVVVLSCQDFRLQ